jgi:hypothetical protein
MGALVAIVEGHGEEQALPVLLRRIAAWKFVWDGAHVPDPDLPRNAKGWMKDRTQGLRYSPVSDQAAFSERLNLDDALASSRSFRKLVAAWIGLFG